MGALLNESGDMLPPDDLYEACRVAGKYVKHLGGNQWDFSHLLGMEPDPVFVYLVNRYLKIVLSRKEPRGWKLPETTLIYPWIVKMFPDADYVHWVRDPRDSILGAHITDDLTNFGVTYDKPAGDTLMMRAISWKYQRDIVRATPPPKRVLHMRFEDFVLDHEAAVARLSAFLGRPLGRVIMRPETVGRWRASEEDFSRFEGLFKQDMVEQGYA